ncbi:hypothetical protein BS47DRAFT_1335480 [Hydnum rufescens UP504]|uniref:Uncharacterized protein n=1 Tax=Hydnum rufescens UP504 TaxID=1448309 RepID=A0A9P6BAK9_9AGAM|nr:hypothetical protein BS47DRAFT_1335480 [Hydnum rufescens UP504]
MQAQASWSSSLFFSPLMVLYKILNWAHLGPIRTKSTLTWKQNSSKSLNQHSSLAKVFHFLFLSHFHAHFR